MNKVLGNSTYSIVTAVNNTVFYTWNLLKEKSNALTTTKQKRWCDGLQFLIVNCTVINLGGKVQTLESSRPGVECDLECHHGRFLKHFKPWFLHHVKRNLKLNELVNVKSLVSSLAHIRHLLKNLIALICYRVY